MTPVQDEALRTFSRILGTCILIGFGLSTLWFVAYEGGLVCAIHPRLFPMTDQECTLLTYGGIGIFKMLVLVLFVAPWIAIRLELRRRGTRPET